MERLTERFSNGQAAVYGCGNNCKYNYKFCNNHLEDCPTINEIYEKLATYEELEDKLETVYGECDGLLKTVVNSLVKHEGAEFDTPAKARLLTDEDVDKWESFKDAEEQGLLLRLPKNFKKWCEKIGDDVYLIDGGDITPMLVINIGFDCDMEFSMLICDDPEGEFSKPFEITCGLDTFNKTVFLTKEEADAALERMEKKV